MNKREIALKIARGVLYAGFFSVLGEGCREKTSAASKEGWKGTKSLYNNVYNLFKRPAK